MKNKKRNAILKINHFQIANKQVELTPCPLAASRRRGLLKNNPRVSSAQSKNPPWPTTVL